MDEPDVEVVDAADPTLVDDVTGLLRQVAGDKGVDGLSEARRRALDRAVEGTDLDVLAVTARDPAHGGLVGYAQIDDEGDRTAASGEVVVLPGGGDGARLFDRLLDSAVAAFRAAGGGSVRLWVTHADAASDARVGTHGFAGERDLIQLRCALPLPPPVRDDEVVSTRTFRVGQDEPAWLVTNNRAFAGHPEQGKWDLATIRAREAEPWFDSDGFRIHEADGRLAGSCWTKVHATASPSLGEIYVISVDPDFRGRGLGRALTRAGLEWLASVGVATGMLYVDAANTAAVKLYLSMGFTTHHVDRSYVADLPPAVD